MVNLIKEIAKHLEFCGIGTITTIDEDGDIFWGKMPDKPDNAICVYSIDSALPGDPRGARIQIMNRAKTTAEAYEKALEIADELDEFRGFLHGDGILVRIEIINSANGLGSDKVMRELYSTNVRVYYCE